MSEATTRPKRDGALGAISTIANGLNLSVQPLEAADLLRDPVITSDSLLRRGPGPAAWSRDGRVAYYSVERGTGMTLHLMVGGPDEEPTVWSDGTLVMNAGQGSVMDRSFAGGPVFSPDGKLVAVSASEVSDGPSGIYLFDGPNTYRRATRRFGSHRHPAFSADGQLLAFVANSGGEDSIWTVPVAGGPATERVGEELNACNPAWSPCGRYLAFTAGVGEDALSCRVGVLDLITNELRLLTPGGSVHSRFPSWSVSDGGASELYVLSDVYGYDAVWRIDPVTGRKTRSTPKRTADVGEFSVSADGGTLVYVAYERTDAQLWVCGRDGQDAKRLDAGHGVHHWPAIDPTSERVWVRRETPFQAPEPLTYLLDGTATPTEPATESDTVLVTQVEFVSFDGQLVDGVLYQPSKTALAALGAPLPALLYIHGGPNGQHTNGYWPLFHRLAQEGFVVLAPNCRGSTGYGREWMDANIHDWGEGDRRDWVAAVEFLKALPYVSKDKIGIWGRSYGGYSTVRGLALEPDVFKAGIAHFGPINLAAFYEETTVRHLMMHNFGHPSEQASSYLRSSTHQHLDAIRGPLLMLQGAEDHGVPLDQMKLVYDELAARSGRVAYVEYPREGHGFNEPAHVYDAAARIIDFWRTELRGD